jgi:hypothetical protein
VEKVITQVVQVMQVVLLVVVILVERHAVLAHRETMVVLAMAQVHQQAVEVVQEQQEQMSQEPNHHIMAV